MNIKKENGSMAIFVLVGLLFMTAFLIITYGNLSNKSKSVSEQYDVIKGIYSNGDSTNEDAYEEAYTALRTKNKQTLTLELDVLQGKNTSSIELANPYAGYIKNYTIYGSAAGVGDYIGIDEDGTPIYQIPIRIWKQKLAAGLTEGDIPAQEKADYYTDYNINIRTQAALSQGDYIEYSTLKLTRSDTTEENISYNDYIPRIPTYEDYTKIEILSTNAPAKVIIEYTGYTI